MVLVPVGTTRWVISTCRPACDAPPRPPTPHAAAHHDLLRCVCAAPPPPPPGPTRFNALLVTQNLRRAAGWGEVGRGGRTGLRPAVAKHAVPSPTVPSQTLAWPNGLQPWRKVGPRGEWRRVARRGAAQCSSKAHWPVWSGVKDVGGVNNLSSRARGGARWPGAVWGRDRRRYATQHGDMFRAQRTRLRYRPAPRRLSLRRRLVHATFKQVTSLAVAEGARAALRRGRRMNTFNRSECRNVLPNRWRTVGAREPSGRRRNGNRLQNQTPARLIIAK